MPRLGELLVATGLLTIEQVEQALRAQVMWGGRLGTNLIELGYLDLDALATALGKQHKMPAALAKHFDKADRELQQKLSGDVAERYSAVPLIRVQAEKIAVAFVSPIDARGMAIIADELEITPAQLIASVAAELRIRYHLERVYRIPRGSRFLRARGKTNPPFPQFEIAQIEFEDSEVNIPLTPEPPSTIELRPAGATPAPAPEPTPTPEPKPTPTPEPKPAPKPELKAEPKPVPKPEPKAEPKPAAKTTPIPSILKPPALSPMPAPKPKAEPAAAKPDLKARLGLTAKPKTAPEPAPKPAPAPAPKPELVANTKPTLVPVPREPEPAAKPTLEPTPKPAPAAKTKPALVSVPQEPEPAPEAAPEDEIEGETDAYVHAGPPPLELDPIESTGSPLDSIDPIAEPSLSIDITEQLDDYSSLAELDDDESNRAATSPVIDGAAPPAVEDEPSGRDRRKYVRTITDEPFTESERQALARIAIRRVVVNAAPAGQTLGEATRAIRRGTSRDRIAELVVETLARFVPSCDAAILLVVRGDVAIGWKGFSRFAATLPEIGLPLDEPGLATRAIQRGTSVRSPCGDLSPIDQLLLVSLGSETGDLVIIPVSIAGRVMCLIAMVDAEQTPMSAAESIAAAAGAAFARLMRDAAR